MSAGASPEWLSEFVPRRWLRNGHVQTIAGNYIRRAVALPPAEKLLIEVEAAATEYGPTWIVCECHLQP